MLKAFDPLVLHLTEACLGRRKNQASLSFGESLDGTRDVLILAARELTDLLAIVPAAGALRKRFRLARVHVVASERCASVLAHRPEVFEVVTWSGDETPMLSRSTIRWILDLRRRRFDLAIATDAGEARRERVAAVLAGAKLRLGAHPTGGDPTLNLVVATPPRSGYRPAQSLEFLSFLGIPREQLAPGWHIPEADSRYAERLLSLRRKGSRGWLLGVDPGVALGGVRPHPAKLAWLVERAAAHGALPFVLTEDRDGEPATHFRGILKTPTLEAPSRGLRDVLSFLGSCDLFLAGNTSLLHFAVALGVPTVGVFSRDEAERWVPTDHPGCRVLRWSPGERVREAEFLETVEQVRAEQAAAPAAEAEEETDGAPAPEDAAAPGRARTG